MGGGAGYTVYKGVPKEWLDLDNYKVKIVSVIKISKSIKNKLDFNKMINRFYQMNGCKYGYQNLLFGWIDHYKKNFPYGLSMELINSLLPYIEYYFPEILNRFREISRP